MISHSVPAASAAPCLYATMHKFKTHLARYMRALEDGRASGVVLRRYGRPVAMIVPYRPRKSADHVD